jgi:hypothetical protein
MEDIFKGLKVQIKSTLSSKNLIVVAQMGSLTYVHQQKNSKYTVVNSYSEILLSNKGVNY